MRNLFICFIIGLLFSINTFAQGEKKIEVIGDSITNKDFFFVSDVHYHNDDLSFIGAMSLYVHEKYGITNVALEMGRSWAYLINRYIQDGDSTIFYFPRYVKNSAVLEKWRTANLSLPKDKQIIIVGVDFERGEFIKALQLIFKKHSESAKTELYRYIFGFPDSVCRYRSILVKEQRDFRKKTYAEAQDIFESEKETLRLLLHDDFDIVAHILENPVTEKEFGKRDMKMPVSLLEQLRNKRFVCFLGGNHTNVYRHFSAINKYLRQTGNNVTIVTEVCKNFPAFNKKANVTASPDYMTLGPQDVRTNDSILALAFGKYHKPGYFSLINQGEFKGLVKKDNKGIPTYYVFSDLLSE